MDLLRYRLDGVTRPRHLLNESRPHELNPFLVQHPANAMVYYKFSPSGIAD
jgi:hypothetical protein